MTPICRMATTQERSGQWYNSRPVRPYADRGKDPRRFLLGALDNAVRRTRLIDDQHTPACRRSSPAFQVGTRLDETRKAG